MKPLPVAALLLAAIAARADAAPPDAETFDKAAKPFLAKHCAECHTGEKAKNGSVGLIRSKVVA